MTGIREAIEGVVREKVVINVVPGTVRKIAGDSCTVRSDTDGRDYHKVSLNALAEQKADRLVLTPKTGSKVTIGVLPNGADAVILAMSEVDKVAFKKGATEFEADADGYKIDRNGQNLKQVLNDYIDEINKIVVIQGTSVNVAATTAIKERLNQILK